MGYLSNYKKEDFRQLSWQEYGKTLEILADKVSDYVLRSNLKVDAVVPILRAGAIPGTTLAYKLKVLRILPVQYKYFFSEGNMELRAILRLQTSELPEKPTLLVVEGNHCFGLTAQTAINDLKESFPGCRILYAADHADHSYQKMSGVEECFYGNLTNETRALSEEECKEKGIFPLSFLFPWENIEEEFETVQGKQYEYADKDSAIKGSELKKTLKL
ncbi:MAG: hypothetical protein JW727_04490 [Candidatus Aenigmarchaeota archaeon]|nr:hypothetical protein [Candidatus Aenigmarchaeota archaeon]